jgi:flagellar hook-length control protein FliK
MVAAANSGQGPAVSHQTQSVEGSGGAKQARGAKKSAFGAFAKLLAGLTRKTGAGGKEAGEPGTALAGTEKTARGLKNTSPKKAEAQEAGSPLPGGEKIRHRDRRFLAALQGEGEVPGSEAGLQDGPVKKSKGAQKNPEKEEAELPAAGSSGALFRGDPLPAEPESGSVPGGTDQEGSLRVAGAENQVQDLPEGVSRGKQGESADPEEASAATNPGTAAASSRHTREAEPEEPGPAKKEKAGETRNSRKNRERFVLEVRDLRTEGPVSGQEPGPEAGAERTADLVVELGDRGGTREPDQPGQVKTAGRAFEDILARELHQNLNGDIVRQASILVRDGGEGTIRLSLKPESLGMVKVRLEMAENKITGRIIVESNEALRAFERELNSLEQAFRDSGFAGASLEMALAGDGGQNGQGQWNGDAAQAFLSSRAVSSSYDAMAETMDVLTIEAGFDGFTGPGVSRVNVLV